MKTAAEFWARVDKTGDCWEWQGGKNNTGYGTVDWFGKTAVAHRVAAFLEGLVADVMAPKDKSSHGFVLHQCDNPGCCNPKHFKIGTYTDNMLDMYNKARHPVYRGASHTNSKLSTEQVAFIREAYKTRNYRQQDLADMFGVSQMAISLIVRGKTYV